MTRIVGGALKGRTLIAPPGSTTRPTADRARQTLFDILLHAPWFGREAMARATVLDAFAGTGALGLEACSRGAQSAVFIENNRAALAALRANIAACRAPGRIVAADATTPPPAKNQPPATLVFFDPPYGKFLIEAALPALVRTGWIAPGAIIIAERGRDDPTDLPQTTPETESPYTALGLIPLQERVLGAARLSILALPDANTTGP